MGIKERKEKHREDLKQLILNAAKKLFTTDGYEATTIRKIAAEIEFSPTTIYLYYKDKNDILYALQKEGFHIMANQFQALLQVDHPFERLKAMGRTYIQFAFDNPEFYDLMFLLKDPLQDMQAPCGDEQEWEEGVRSFDFLKQTIIDCQQVGYFQGQDPGLQSMWVWGTVHGLCSMHLSNRLDIISKLHLDSGNALQTLSAIFESFVLNLEKIR
ncbi:MAG: TetR/AcrR family transcriptional regulator [Candidatus Pseudobacter hemicellulosilyticus]|uniref:TetR/AcrR family transcriptional regulator n=1 Tax=Candidatus Pseudobacter hemicellulosilyticus TaxID=3121375 RepID=A0AAJ5WMN1_9BACT|nr:MAG: TetR/AcrR family transcriptional regulator [Pseudobacter sp.]